MNKKAYLNIVTKNSSKTFKKQDNSPPDMILEKNYNLTRKIKTFKAKK